MYNIFFKMPLLLPYYCHFFVKITYMVANGHAVRSVLFCLDLEGAGGEVGGIDEVSTGEGLPAVAGSHGALHGIALQAYGIALDLYGLGGVVEAVLVGNLEGAQCGAVRGVHALGMVEGEDKALALALGTAYGGARGYDVGEAVVVVQGYAAEALADGALVAGMHIEGVALVARYGHLAMGDLSSQLALHIAEVGP